MYTCRFEVAQDCSGGLGNLFYYVVDGERFAYVDLLSLEVAGLSPESRRVLIPLEAGQTVGVESINCSTMVGTQDGRLRSLFIGELVHPF